MNDAIRAPGAKVHPLPTRYRMVVAYDGTAFHGWQMQPAHSSIQQALQDALEHISGENVRIHSSGRTDTGVHARGQVAHFDLAKKITPHHLQRGLNANLPETIRVVSLRKAAPDFHARFDATGKEYRYFIDNSTVPWPHLRLYRAHERVPLDVPSMKKAAAMLEGKHDFAAFSANPNREIEGTVRHLHRLTVIKRGTDIILTAHGDGFLYKMVRSLAGFLIRVGRGELAPEMAREILHSKIRTARVPTAHPQGLFLWKVQYPRRRTSSLSPSPE